MTAKEYLGQAYRIDQRINLKMEQVASLHALATKATATYSDMPKGYGNVHSGENVIVKIIELENQMNADVDELVNLKEKIMGMIRRITDVEKQLLLELRYISIASWETIAERMNYSLQHVFRLHNAALKEFTLLLEDESKCD